MSRTINFEVKRSCKLELLDTENPGLFEYHAEIVSGTKTQNVTGYIFKKSVNRLIDAIKAGETPPNERNWIKVTPEFLEELRQFGYADENRTSDEESFKPWKELEKHPGTILVRNAGDCHMIFSIDDVPYPMGLHFSTYTGRISSKVYRLKKAREILAARSDVRNIKDYEPYDDDEYGTKGLDFSWAPSAEDYVRMWNRCLEKNDKCGKTSYHHPSNFRYEAVFDLDLLGLRAGGAAKYDEYYKEDGDDDE